MYALYASLHSDTVQVSCSQLFPQLLEPLKVNIGHSAGIDMARLPVLVMWLQNALQFVRMTVLQRNNLIVAGAWWRRA